MGFGTKRYRQEAFIPSAYERTAHFGHGVIIALDNLEMVLQNGDLFLYG
jgi:pyruvate/2-oxoacid:ferredoxin oxidoreductase beta subunit